MSFEPVVLKEPEPQGFVKKEEYARRPRREEGKKKREREHYRVVQEEKNTKQGIIKKENEALFQYLSCLVVQPGPDRQQVLECHQQNYEGPEYQRGGEKAHHGPQFGVKGQGNVSQKQPKSCNGAEQQRCGDGLFNIGKEIAKSKGAIIGNTFYR